MGAQTWPDATSRSRLATPMALACVAQLASPVDGRNMLQKTQASGENACSRKT